MNLKKKLDVSFCERPPHGKSLIAFYETFLLILTKFLFWHGGCALDLHSMRFRHFLIFLISLVPKYYVVQLFVRQLLYTMFISNNLPFFCLWWKENLVKHRKFWKYYQTDYLQNMFLLFLFLLTNNFVENSHI